MRVNPYQSYEDIKRIILEEDRNYRVWDFGNKPSSRGPNFQSGNFTISIIDRFGDNIPSVISYETLMGFQLPHTPTIILDSNVTSVLNEFVLHPDRLSSDKTKAVVKLLDYFIHTKVDYSPLFYSLEAFSKNKNFDFSDQYIEFSKSLLSLSMMDRLHFLKKREIRPDKEIFEWYVEKLESSDLDEMAGRLHEISAQMLSSYNEKLNVTYVTLLKMALIHKTSNKSIASKMKMLFDFIFSNFGAMLGEEIGIAVYYFAGKLDRFISFQKGAQFERVISNFRSTTWDINLLRYPAHLLTQSKSPFQLAKICTCEKQLAYIGRKFFIPRLFASGEQFYPALMVDYDDLFKIYPKPTMDRLFQLNKEFEKTRMERKADQLVAPDDTKIEELKLSLEQEIKALCS